VEYPCLDIIDSMEDPEVYSNPSKPEVEAATDDGGDPPLQTGATKAGGKKRAKTGCLSELGLFF
jgi:hypothetical protein